MHGGAELVRRRGGPHRGDRNDDRIRGELLGGYDSGESRFDGETANPAALLHRSPAAASEKAASHDRRFDKVFIYPGHCIFLSI
jgi:hypothetical protein